MGAFPFLERPSVNCPVPCMVRCSSRNIPQWTLLKYALCTTGKACSHRMFDASFHARGAFVAAAALTKTDHGERKELASVLPAHGHFGTGKGSEKKPGPQRRERRLLGVHRSCKCVFWVSRCELPVARRPLRLRREKASCTTSCMQGCCFCVRYIREISQRPSGIGDLERVAGVEAGHFRFSRLSVFHLLQTTTEAVQKKESPNDCSCGAKSEGSEDRLPPRPLEYSHALLS